MSSNMNVSDRYWLKLSSAANSQLQLQVLPNGTTTEWDFYIPPVLPRKRKRKSYVEKLQKKMGR